MLKLCFDLKSFGVTSCSCIAVDGIFCLLVRWSSSMVETLWKKCLDTHSHTQRIGVCPVVAFCHKGRHKHPAGRFFRACVFTIFLPHIWNGFIFFCGFCNVFLVPCIVLVSEMLSFTMVTKFNYFLIWKLHWFVLYEVVSKASRGSLLQQWFIRFSCVFSIQCFPKTSFFFNV